MKQPKPTNIDCLKRFLTEQPHRDRIRIMDEENAQADEAAKRNAEIRARRNIKGGNNA